jgi:hypothetical protein
MLLGNALWFQMSWLNLSIVSDDFGSDEVVATDEEDLVALQFQVAVEGAGQHLHGGDEDAEGFGEQGDDWVEKVAGPKKLFVVA